MSEAARDAAQRRIIMTLRLFFQQQLAAPDLSDKSRGAFSDAVREFDRVFGPLKRASKQTRPVPARRGRPRALTRADVDPSLNRGRA